jgi:hypothetical protein
MMRPDTDTCRSTSPRPRRILDAPWSLRATLSLAARLAALLAALWVVASASAAMIMPRDDRPRTPNRLIIRHEAVIRCDLDAERGPLTCTIRVIVAFSEPMPDLIAMGLEVTLVDSIQRWLPTSTSADQRVLTFEQTFSRADTDNRDISSIEVRHPLTVPRGRVPVFPIGYSAPDLWGAPLHLTVDLPDSVHPKEDLWLSLSFRDSGPGRHVLTEVIDEKYPSFSAFLYGASRWTWGGPLLGIACNMRGSAESGLGCPTLIAGWEMSSHDWLLYQLVAEVDFTGTLAFVPSVETALSLGSAGFGLRVGLPVDVIPDPRVGIRTLLTVSAWSFTGGLGVDVFPWQPSRGHTLMPIFQAQFSL